MTHYAAPPGGGRGLASSTDKTHLYSKVYFNIFALTQDFEASFDELIEQDRHEILCDKAVWQQFGIWLHSYGRQISDPAKHIESGSALNYLSALTTMASRKWPSHATWINKFDTWYADLRREVEKTIGRRIIEAGDDDGEELQDISRVLLIRLNQLWNAVGSRDALIKACAASMTWFCLGRSAEFKYMSGNRTHTITGRVCTEFLPHSSIISYNISSQVAL